MWKATFFDIDLGEVTLTSFGNEPETALRKLIAAAVEKGDGTEFPDSDFFMGAATLLSKIEASLEDAPSYTGEYFNQWTITVEPCMEEQVTQARVIFVDSSLDYTTRVNGTVRDVVEYFSQPVSINDRTAQAVGLFVTNDKGLAMRVPLREVRPTTWSVHRVDNPYAKAEKQERVYVGDVQALYKRDAYEVARQQFNLSWMTKLILEEKSDA